MRAPTLLLLGAIFALGTISRAQQPETPSDADQRMRFLRAREQMRTIPATPAPESAAPRPKPRPLATPRPAPPPPEPEPEPPVPQPTPRPQPKPEPRAKPTPLLTITPKPVTPRPSAPDPQRTQRQTTTAPVNIVKESASEQDILPAEPERRGWFRKGPKYVYLTDAIRSQIDRAPVRRNRWRYIVVHNSATRQGSAKAFDYYHKRVRKMQNGLAYHFVIGNGTSTGDGQIEIGDRWRRQINGGHVHSDYLNNIALGICFVGDFNRDLPTKRQLESLDELIRYLRKRVGKVDGKISIVKPHRGINPPRWPTDCPGNRFPYRWLNERFN